MNFKELKNADEEYKLKIKYDDLWFGFEYDAEILGEAPPFYNPLDQTMCHPEHSSISLTEINAIEDKIYFPNERHLELGRSLIFQFIEELYPMLVDEVDNIFSKKGAYGRFKDFLVTKSIGDQWHKYKNYYTALSLIEWANDQGLEVTELDRIHL
ncbi:MAG: hypothetical protein KC646_07315 [Candidatus Cloacimonetes bacterium]|nr:hypothetical protein [Candidatus Cloacimonadota bacterium]